MNRLSVSEVLARANATMVQPGFDVTGALASLLAGVAAALPADAAAVLVEAEGNLEVLAATSHRVADLELYQAQVDEGPCVDAIRLGEAVGLTGAAALAERWPVAGPVIVEAGYLSVQAVPLTFQGLAFGALNVFRTDDTDFLTQQAECRALADAVTLVIVSGHVGVDHLTAGLRAALEDRAVVEQAKGALAHALSLQMPAAFDTLLALAEEDGAPLGVAARRVMEQARTGSLGRPASTS
jgi:hypothetical protein